MSLTELRMLARELGPGSSAAGLVERLDRLRRDTAGPFDPVRAELFWSGHAVVVVDTDSESDAAQDTLVMRRMSWPPPGPSTLPPWHAVDGN